jgi:hypothetical protein
VATGENKSVNYVADITKYWESQKINNLQEKRSRLSTGKQRAEMGVNNASPEFQRTLSSQCRKWPKNSEFPKDRVIIRVLS